MEERNNKGIIQLHSDVKSLLNSFVESFSPSSFGEFTTDPSQSNLIKNKESYSILKVIPSNSVIEFGAEWNKNYGCIMGMVPFGFKLIMKNPIEVQIVRKTLSCLSESGVLLVLVPVNFCVSPQFEEVRKEIIDNYALDAVIDIPQNRLAANTGIKSNLLVIRNGMANANCYMGRMDGGWQEQIESFKNKRGDFWLDYTKLINRIDRNYHHPSHDSLKQFLDESETSAIEELCDVILGRPPIKDVVSEVKTTLPFLSRRIVRTGKIEFDEKTKYLKESLLDGRYERAIPKEGDIIVSLDVNLGTLYSFQKDDPRVILGDGLAILRPKGASGEYIKSYLSFKEGRSVFAQQADMKAMGSLVRRLSINALKAIKIPIVPLDTLSLNKISDKNIEIADRDELIVIKSELHKVLQAIEEKSSEILEFSKNRFDKVDAKLEILDSKVDEILKVLKDIQSRIDKIKQQPREDEEKLKKIYRTIDNKLNAIIDKKTFEDYVDDVKDWFEYWEFLDEASKSFLPSAEYLFDEIHHLGADDFSPFIIQYCRALENEILKKLFEAYHDDLKSRMNEDSLAKLIDKDILDRASKANVFAKFVIKDDRKYTLGQMNWILNLTKTSSSTYKNSDLLQDFRMFILKYYEDEVIQKSYLKKIDVITSDFRNKSAHPYIMGLEIAKECQVLVREGLNYFFDRKR